MMTLTNNMLRDQRIAVSPSLFSDDSDSNRRRLKEQLSVYSFQFKTAQNCFDTQRVALCGKVGGMKDDVCIALQLGIHFSTNASLYIAINITLSCLLKQSYHGRHLFRGFCSFRSNTRNLLYLNTRNLLYLRGRFENLTSELRAKGMNSFVTSLNM